MSLEHAFDLWDWATVLSLVIVGIIVGYVLLPFAWPDRQAQGRAYPALTAGVLATLVFGIFFVFLTSFRYAAALAAGVDTVSAARTIATGFEAAIFAAMMGVGLHFRAPQVRSRTLDDISAQLNEISRLAAVASAAAEAAYAAASAADDRTLGQAERAVEDRARGIRIEDVSTDTNDRAINIQERLPKK